MVRLRVEIGRDGCIAEGSRSRPTRSIRQPSTSGSSPAKIAYRGLHLDGRAGMRKQRHVIVVVEDRQHALSGFAAQLHMCHQRNAGRRICKRDRHRAHAILDRFAPATAPARVTCGILFRSSQIVGIAGLRLPIESSSTDQALRISAGSSSDSSMKCTRLRVAGKSIVPRSGRCFRRGGHRYVVRGCKRAVQVVYAHVRH